jgi:hypothetical protein
MQSVLRNSAEFARAPARTKRELYEELAILGTFIANTRRELQARPDAAMAARTKAAAKGYLEGLLKVDVARIHLTASGLEIR